jgi:carbonic anhydrase/acetyltransferase-like protein (isoleucine patch superfamily)
MAEAARDLESSPDDKGKVVPLRPDGAPAAEVGKAEGGLTLRFSLVLPKLPKLPSLNSVQSWTHQQMINAALIGVVALMAAYLGWQHVKASAPPHIEAPANVRANVATSFNPTVESPNVGPGTYVDKLASVIGNVTIGEHVFVGPFASIRGDEGQPIVIGNGSNVQDMVVLHALETFENGESIENNLVTVDGRKYAVYIGAGVSLAHQSQVHGPAAVGDHTFVGMQALVFKSVVGKNVVIEPGAKLIGVTVAEGRYVPAGMVLTAQKDADALPKITGSYPFAKLNDGVLHVNEQFADKYLELTTGAAK